MEGFHPCGGVGGGSRALERGEIEESAAFIDGEFWVVFEAGDYSVGVLADEFG